MKEIKAAESGSKSSTMPKASGTVDKEFHSSAFYDFFRSHDNTERKFKHSFFFKLIGIGKFDAGLRLFRNSFAKSCENSLIVTFVSNLYNSLLRCSVRSYAVVLLYFGIYAFTINAIKYAIGNTESIMSDNSYYSLLLIVISLLFLPVKASFAAFLKKSKILSFICESFFTIDMLDNINSNDIYRPSNGTLILIGTLLGLITYMIPVSLIISLILLILLLLSFFKAPENSIPFLILSAPFCSVENLSFLSFAAFCAYLFKVMRGKRSFAFGYYDLLTLLFVLIMFSAGFNSAEKLFSSEVVCMIALSLSYFILRNCIRNEKIGRKCVYSLGLCAAAASGMMVFERLFYYGYVHAAERAINVEFDIYPISLFESSIHFGEFLLLLLPFSVMSLIIADSNSKKILYFISVALCAASLVLTGSKGILLAFAICILIYITASFRNPFASLVTVIFVYAALSLFVTNSAFLGNDRFFNVNDYKESIILAASDIISDNFVAGIGFGKENFTDVFRTYSHYGTGNISSCYNFYLQLIVQLGVFGFAYFICMSVGYFKMQFSALSHNRRKSLFASLTAISSISSISALYLRGLTSFVWSDHRVFFMFFIIISLSSAMYYTSFAERTTYLEE